MSSKSQKVAKLNALAASFFLAVGPSMTWAQSSTKVQTLTGAVKACSDEKGNKIECEEKEKEDPMQILRERLSDFKNLAYQPGNPANQDYLTQFSRSSKATLDYINRSALHLDSDAPAFASAAASPEYAELKSDIAELDKYLNFMQCTTQGDMNNKALDKNLQGAMTAGLQSDFSGENCPSCQQKKGDILKQINEKITKDSQKNISEGDLAKDLSNQALSDEIKSYVAYYHMAESAVSPSGNVVDHIANNICGKKLNPFADKMVASNFDGLWGVNQAAYNKIIKPSTDNLKQFNNFACSAEEKNLVRSLVAKHEGTYVKHHGNKSANANAVFASVNSATAKLNALLDKAEKVSISKKGANNLATLQDPANKAAAEAFAAYQKEYMKLAKSSGTNLMLLPGVKMKMGQIVFPEKAKIENGKIKYPRHQALKSPADVKSAINEYGDHYAAQLRGLMRMKSNDIATKAFTKNNLANLVLMNPHSVQALVEKDPKYAAAVCKVINDGISWDKGTRTATTAGLVVGGVGLVIAGGAGGVALLGMAGVETGAAGAAIAGVAGSAAIMTPIAVAGDLSFAALTFDNANKAEQNARAIENIEKDLLLNYTKNGGDAKVAAELQELSKSKDAAVRQIAFDLGTLGAMHVGIKYVAPMAAKLILAQKQANLAAKEAKLLELRKELNAVKKELNASAKENAQVAKYWEGKNPNEPGLGEFKDTAKLDAAKAKNAGQAAKVVGKMLDEVADVKSPWQSYKPSRADIDLLYSKIPAKDIRFNRSLQLMRELKMNPSSEEGALVRKIRLAYEEMVKKAKTCKGASCPVMSKSLEACVKKTPAECADDLTDEAITFCNTTGK